MKLELSDIGKKAVVGFNGSAEPLEKRSKEDLLKLAYLAVDSQSPALKSYFVSFPEVEIRAHREQEKKTQLTSSISDQKPETNEAVEPDKPEDKLEDVTEDKPEDVTEDKPNEKPAKGGK